MQTRAQEKLYILDYDESQIVGAKLPSNEQVLRLLFYNHRKVKLSLRGAAYLVIKEVEVFWAKARVPTNNVDKSALKLEGLYQEWKGLQKSSNRRTTTQENREQDFVATFNNLFGIAHANALQLITIEEDKLFLLSQRQEGRPGSMIGSDRLLLEKENRKLYREAVGKRKSGEYVANIHAKMLTACREELPNPHKNCIHEILSTLVCHENDLSRISTELRNLQCKYKEATNKLHFGTSKLATTECNGNGTTFGFTRKVTTIHDLNEKFSNQIEELNHSREVIISNTRQCILTLNTEKCKFRQFHEKTVEYLKRYAIKSNDTAVINNCERDICEMHKLFVKEVLFIQKCEAELQPLFQLCNLPGITSCCCFKDYDWLPKGKSFHAVDDLANEIKCLMGTTISKAFAQFHVRQAIDVKSVLAAYLMNLELSEIVLKEKLNIFSSLG